MSKVNAMQAMREARYAARMTNKAVGPTARAVEAAAQVETAPPAPVMPVDSSPGDDVGAVQLFPVPADQGTPENAEPAEAEALCGHRSMNNRICSRPAGHAEKNHRYN